MSNHNQETALAEIAADTRLAPVYGYWCKLCGENDAPAFDRLDPVELPLAVLPYLSLLDVVDGGQSFRVRLVGTGTTAAVGRNATGDHLDATTTGHIPLAALKRYRAVVDAGRPALEIVDYEMPDGTRFKNRLLTLPFSRAGDFIDRLLGVYSPSSLRLAKQMLRDITAPAYAEVLRTTSIL